MILDEIKKANIQALREHNTVARNAYGVFLSRAKLLEISKRESNGKVEDADIVPLLQKMLKELEEEKSNYEKVKNLEQTKVIATQISLLTGFLPKMMSEEEIYAIISNLPDKSIPVVMKKFKAEFGLKCDMRLVGEVLKKF